MDRVSAITLDMRIAEEFVLVDEGGFGSSRDCQRALREIRTAIAQVVWPPGNDRFLIYPESGKKKGQGSGVRPIRDAFIMELERMGWENEARFPVSTPSSMADFGNMDASKVFDGMPFLVEWETGNISSSHRAMNKLCVGLVEQAICGGVLIVPTKDFAKYLTDRIGNLWELQPYFPLWRSIRLASGCLRVIAVEHDAISKAVARIPKGTDGRALL